uniref:Translin associated factor X n=1 Tax=Equus caballus TaxID=9796 RepID=A0A9L0SKR5_HORSE
MSNKEGSGGFRKRKHDNFPHNQRREGKDVNSSSPVMLAFKSFQQELDARHDKYERLVKLSRDITVESKRTIFLLHRITSAPDMEEILTESEIKLDGVRQKILQVAQELSGEDMHQFHRAITTGLQEYVEAVSFQHFIKTRSLISMDEINKQLIFTTEDNGKENKTSCSDAQDKQFGTWRLKITPVDYLLGVADLTGELMRMCINSVGNGDIDTPFETAVTCVLQELILLHEWGSFYYSGCGPQTTSISTTQERDRNAESQTPPQNQNLHLTRSQGD